MLEPAVPEGHPRVACYSERWILLNEYLPGCIIIPLKISRTFKRFSSNLLPLVSVRFSQSLLLIANLLYWYYYLLYTCPGSIVTQIICSLGYHILPQSKNRIEATLEGLTFRADANQSLHGSLLLNDISVKDLDADGAPPGRVVPRRWLLYCYPALLQIEAVSVVTTNDALN